MTVIEISIRNLEYFMQRLLENSFERLCVQYLAETADVRKYLLWNQEWNGERRKIERKGWIVMYHKGLGMKVMACAIAGGLIFSGCLGISGTEKEKGIYEEGGEDVCEKISEERKVSEAGVEEERDTEKGNGEKEEKGNGEEAETEEGVRETEIKKEEGKRNGEEAEKGKGREKRDEAAVKTVQKDWSGYFDGLQGAAVLYDASKRQFSIYHEKTALTRRSPCSTFKIVSSLAALENGILDLDDSVRKWSGEVFWKEDWNRDIDFQDAFRASCVWYFREVTDEIGKELMQEELDRLSYGNCDISDWEGRMNANNHNRALTGFWIESSLLISPKEQTEVMERIFGRNSVYSDKTRNALKEVMLVKDAGETDVLIYGKTGMGMAEGIVVDAWFTGFAETEQGNMYFCVYLGRDDEREVSSAKARETAVRLVLGEL